MSRSTWQTPELLAGRRRVRHKALAEQAPPPLAHRWQEPLWLTVSEEDLPAQDQRGRLELRADDNRLVYRQLLKSDDIDRSGPLPRLRVEAALLANDPPRESIVSREVTKGQWQDAPRRGIPETFHVTNASLLAWVREQVVPEESISFVPIGGLANQLFEAGAMYGFHRRTGRIPVCQLWKARSPSMIAPRPTYWDTVFPQLVALGEGYRACPLTTRAYGDPSFTWTEIPAEHTHQALWGHFLSYRYFDDYREDLLSLLLDYPPTRAIVDEAWRRLRAALGYSSRPLVSVHVRRGDSLKNRTLAVMNMGYYEGAMDRFGGADFAVFSDDLPWCRAHFRGGNITFVDGNADWVDLFLMARCDHHIIANSTYSWWGAYLNRAPEPRVIHPLPWFLGEKQKRDLSDFFPPGWQSIHVPQQS
ncbi:MAG: alpha-1,2-fucosyltransferase [Pseudomonadota bacterium]